MKIHVHILAWNESRILPFTLDYYSIFCEKIFVYDNMSNDSSDDIYKQYSKVEVIKWDSGNEINDMNYIQIKSNAYKEKSRNCDWVIVCDCDEFLYHENLIDKLEEYKSYGITVPKIDGHDMVSEIFPEYDGKLLTDKIKIGSQTYDPMCKRIIFCPFLDMNYGIGAHNFNCAYGVESKEAELKLLHYKFLGKDYVNERYKMLANRVSEFNKQRGLAVHYFNPPMEYMDKMLKEGFKVI